MAAFKIFFFSMICFGALFISAYSTAQGIDRNKDWPNRAGWVKYSELTYVVGISQVNRSQMLLVRTDSDSERGLTYTLLVPNGAKQCFERFSGREYISELSLDGNATELSGAFVCTSEYGDRYVSGVVFSGAEAERIDEAFAIAERDKLEVQIEGMGFYPRFFKSIRK